MCVHAKEMDFLFVLVQNCVISSIHHACIIQGTAQRPEVRIVTWKNEELTTDALPVHGFEHYKAKDYALAHAPFTGIHRYFS